MKSLKKKIISAGVVAAMLASTFAVPVSAANKYPTKHYAAMLRRGIDHLACVDSIFNWTAENYQKIVNVYPAQHASGICWSEGGIVENPTIYLTKMRRAYDCTSICTVGVIVNGVTLGYKDYKIDRAHLSCMGDFDHETIR